MAAAETLRHELHCRRSIYIRQGARSARYGCTGINTHKPASLSGGYQGNRRGEVVLSGAEAASDRSGAGHGEELVPRLSEPRPERQVR